MKKTLVILVICFLSGISYAYPGNGRKSPTVNNTSIRKSEKADNKQERQFASNKRYSGATNSRRSKALKKQQAKSDNGKAL